MSIEVKITAAEVNKLRKQTGAGMMDCKKALKESGGDFEAAIDYLRLKGQKIAAKRADRDATEGAAIAKTTEDGTKGIVVVISCETDFVAKNDDFVAFATGIADLALSEFPADTAALLELTFDGMKLSERISQEVGKIGEKIEVSRYEKLEADSVVAYIHAGNKIGVLIGMNKPVDDDIREVGRNVAMQAAAMRPVALDESGVSPETAERELAIGREKAIQEGKPEQIIEKIAQGNLKRFYKDNTLLNQQYVKNSKQTVRDYVASACDGLVVNGFKRAAIG